MALDSTLLIEDLRNNAACAATKAGDHELDRNFRQLVRQDRVLDSLAHMRGKGLAGFDVGDGIVPAMILGLPPGSSDLI